MRPIGRSLPRTTREQDLALGDGELLVAHAFTLHLAQDLLDDGQVACVLSGSQLNDVK